jgi:hypothetical protein
MEKQKNTSYSIWVVPEGKAYEKLFSIIQDLGKKFNTSIFKPHVTVMVGYAPDENKAKKYTQILASRFRQFDVTLTRIEQRNEKFRSIFAVAESPELVRAEKESKKLFDVPKKYDDPVFHCSFLYGDVEEKRKTEHIEKLQNLLPMKFKAVSFQLLEDRYYEMKWPEIAAYPLMR